MLEVSRLFIYKHLGTMTQLARSLKIVTVIFVFCSSLQYIDPGGAVLSPDFSIATDFRMDLGASRDGQSKILATSGRTHPMHLNNENEVMRIIVAEPQQQYPSTPFPRTHTLHQWLSVFSKCRTWKRTCPTTPRKIVAVLGRHLKTTCCLQ